VEKVVSDAQVILARLFIDCEVAIHFVIPIFGHKLFKTIIVVVVHHHVVHVHHVLLCIWFFICIHNMRLHIHLHVFDLPGGIVSSRGFNPAISNVDLLNATGCGIQVFYALDAGNFASD
jgi:hypothetical protein